MSATSPTPMRLRFAPSPTGMLHVGNARTALFNWLLARGQGGTFILRIEDTDTERSTRASEDGICADLKWLGLNWDEGPDQGGPFPPYRQSERLALYASYATTLRDTGHAYWCFCSAEQLEQERAAALAAGAPPKYSGRCRELSRDEAEARRAAGEPAAIRFVVPADRDVTFVDLVRGPVTFHTSVIGDPVIVRSDGGPAYNFAVVVDDALMKVTHVIRGEDHISNTPRQVLIYEALGLTPPTFAHLSLVLGPDHAPLSKRHGATSVQEFRARGYLPEALVNYLALLGWSPGEGEELMLAPEMARRFDVARVSHSSAVFDTEKLAWMNRHYMKVCEPNRLVDLVMPWFGPAFAEASAGKAAVAALLPLAVGAVDRLEEIPDRVKFVFAWDQAEAARLVAAEVDGAKVVAAFAEAITGAGPLTKESFRAAATKAREVTGIKGKALFHPIRVALTGMDSGPELDLAIPAIDIVAGLLGTQTCLQRCLLVNEAMG
ncbi:MAG: glutamate--tRNA ligase, partial [Acidobacteria bacterium]|nr:glutamate--tRNA ligase [Acidobacteriota bacterium]